MSKFYDVVIAGGGVIGASCAYQLSKRKNLKVALIDAKRPGNATRASAGGLWAIGESVGLGCGVISILPCNPMRCTRRCTVS
jgi:hydrogen cyanide synthase HcnC